MIFQKNSTFLFLAFSLCGCGNSFQITTQPPVSTPTQTSKLAFAGISSITAVYTNHIQLNWNSVVGAASYNIYNLTSGSPVLIASLAPSATSYTVSGLTPQSKYIFRVLSVDSNGLLDSNTNDGRVATLGNPVVVTAPMGNLVAWYKSDVGVTVDGSNNVTAWADQSGNGPNLTVVGGTGPTLQNNQVQGYPALTFTAGSIGAVSGFPTNSDYGTYVVTDMTAAGQGGSVIGSNTVVGAGDHLIYANNTAHYYLYDGTGSTAATSNYPLNSFFLLEETFANSGFGMSLFQNGSVVGTRAAANAITNASINLGAYGANFFPFVGKIAEVLIYSTYDQGTRTAVEEYTRQRYGLATPALASNPVLVNDPAFKFSPGNWSGDTGRGGSIYRSSWNPGSYFVFQWSASSTPTAIIQLPNQATSAMVSYDLNGSFTDSVPGNENITLSGIIPNAVNTLVVYERNSGVFSRWNGGINRLVVSGVFLDAQSSPGIAPPMTKWAVIVGDSITEGYIANAGANDNLVDYSFLMGQSLMNLGYDYCISASGGSGLLVKGDSDLSVPAYYLVQNGIYSSAASRWNLVDQGVSLLDSNNHISAYGSTNTEPSLFFVNYGTNDEATAASLSDFKLSMTGLIGSIRSAAPNAEIEIAMPFGMENSANYPSAGPYINAIRSSVSGYQSLNPNDAKVALVDLGVNFANTLESTYYMNPDFVHPNQFGHALIAATLNDEVLNYLLYGH